MHKKTQNLTRRPRPAPRAFLESDDLKPGEYLEVPCNGCTRCCHGDAVRLTPEDERLGLKTEPHPYIAGALMLAHKPDGACWYLTEHGCSLHPDKPYMCRTMDCRAIAQRYTYTEARKLAKRGIIKISVWRRGLDILGGGDGRLG
jgi:hypothetical protein